jgi:hypothetical protein
MTDKGQMTMKESSGIIPLQVQGLSDEDMSLLESLVVGSGQRILNKVYHDALVSLYGQMDKADDLKTVFNLQGYIQGIRYAMNAPSLLVSQWRSQKNKKKPSERKELSF